MAPAAKRSGHPGKRRRAGVAFGRGDRNKRTSPLLNNAQDAVMRAFSGDGAGVGTEKGVMGRLGVTTHTEWVLKNERRFGQPFAF